MGLKLQQDSDKPGSKRGVYLRKRIRVKISRPHKTPNMISGLKKQPRLGFLYFLAVKQSIEHRFNYFAEIEFLIKKTIRGRIQSTASLINNIFFLFIQYFYDYS